MRSVGIGTNLQLGVLVAEVHQFLEVAAQLSSLRRNLTGIYLTSRTVERDVVALFIYCTVDFHGLLMIVNIQSTNTADAALAHTAGNDGSMRGHTATSGKDTLCSSHTGEVFRRGLDTYKYHLLAVVSMEDNLTASRTW